MPTNPTVNLDVRNFAAVEGDGYTTVTVAKIPPPGDAAYSYRYTGGTEPSNDGTVVEHGTGNGMDTITVRLDSDPRYEIQNVSFENDVANQLTWRGNSPTVAMIMDANTQVETAEYIVTVRDKNTGYYVPCDPTIRNQPT